jgi:uncharacterized protein YdeI (BOF family)
MKSKIIGGLMAVTFLATAPMAFAETNSANVKTKANVNAESNMKTTKNPLPSYKNESHVMLNGMITEVRDDEFDLNYGEGIITVELDQWGWDDVDMAYLRSGDEVTVNGMIDDDLFEGREIKADNLYLNREFVYLVPADQQNKQAMNKSQENKNTRANRNRSINVDAMEDGSYITMTGVVVEQNGDEFTLSGNGQNMRVDTNELDYNPFDDDGLQRIRKGDRVQVYGAIDDGFFDTRKIEADRVISLSQSSKVKAGNKSQ